MNENELYHYGVLGMKWGIRKSRSKKKGLPKAIEILKKDLINYHY